MKIGIQTLFNGNQREPLPRFIEGVARILEERGFASVWISEHAVTFREYDSRYPYPYSDDRRPPEMFGWSGMLDTMTTLTALAMCSTTLRLASSVALLPQRNPVYFAKEAAGIDLLSGGRFIAGVGLGWSGQEYEALGVSFAQRGARMDDYIQVVRSLWQDELSQYAGQFYTLPECIQLPKPVQRPHPPFYIGGDSEAALRRVAAFGQGWTGFRLLPDEVAERVSRLKRVLEANGRELGDIELVASPGEKPCDIDMIARYADLGVAEVVMVLLADDLASFSQQADLLADALVIPARHL